MNIFFDTEFTGLHQNTTLISIGLVAEDGKTFYAEFNDYDKSQCTNWITDNVISKLMFSDKNSQNLQISDNNRFTMKGNTNQVSQYLTLWLKQYKDIQFISDVCHYDFVLLINLLCEEALLLREDICPYCIDINQLIAEKYYISAMEAFNKNREEIVKYVDEDKHNALHDAKVIKSIYDFLT